MKWFPGGDFEFIVIFFLWNEEWNAIIPKSSDNTMLFLFNYMVDYI